MTVEELIHLLQQEDPTKRVSVLVQRSYDGDWSRSVQITYDRATKGVLL